MTSFLQVLRGEALKTRRSWGLTLSLLGPLAVSLIVFSYFVKESEWVMKSTDNLWLSMGRYHFNFFFLLYPLFTALIAFLISNIEHRANGFKQLFVLPAPKFYFYVSKLLLLLGWLAASLGLAMALVYGMGYVLEWLFPAGPFDQYPPPVALGTFFWRLAVALLPVLAIHYFLSIYFDNFIISVGAACFLLVFGMMVYQWDKGYLIPYTYFTAAFMEYVTNEEVGRFGSREVWISLGYAVVFFSAGYWFFARKEVR